MSWSPPSVLYPATGYNSGYGNATYQGVTGTRHKYAFFSPSTYTIEFDTSDNKWYDNSGQNPTHFGRNLVNFPNGPYTTSPETLGTWTDNADVLTIGNNSTSQNSSLQMAGWPTGGGTSTEGSSYSATLEVNSSGWLEYTIPTTSSSGTYALFKSSDGGLSWIQHGQNITHGSLVTDGSFAFDQTLIWIIRSPTEDELARWSPPSTTKKVFCNFW